MQTFLEILKYTLPSLIIFIAVFIIIKAFLENMQNRHLADLKAERQKTITPAKVQAYERTVLFLERILPGNLLLRITRPEMTSIQLQAALIRSIREEYEHNMSQQLFLSDKAWEMVKNAKEELIQLINICAAELDPDAKNYDLTSMILEKSIEKQTSALNKAILFIKEEFRASF
jgi:MinD-like ATPase involved in chromosome partitioning or flagellar assembly